ncbi:MAG: hypothetical protein GY815_17540, partial [Gammaproteobacteria bacterium]|nr:hypothetical protein [Gammaproteobacteria bacterium]
MPIELDPIKSAQKGAEYSGFYRLQDLKRFSDMVRNESGEILVDLKCKHNEQGLAVLLVSAQTDVQLTCERCCGAMEQHLEIETVFTPETRNLDEDQVPTDYEIVAIDEFGMIDFRQLVEDEI